MIWVIPGWSQTDNVSVLNKLGYNFNPSKCDKSNNCPNDNPCTTSENCKASVCGIALTGATDDACSKCVPGSSSMSLWPCTTVGACQDLSKIPKCM